jgi:hypothetical protein
MAHPEVGCVRIYETWHTRLGPDGTCAYQGLVIWLDINGPSCVYGFGDVQDTVNVNVEGDLNVRNTMRCRRNTRQLKLAEQVVVRAYRECLGLLGGDGGVAFDEGSHDTTGSVNTEQY